MILATPLVSGLTDFENYAAALKRRGKLSAHVHVVFSREDDEEEAIAFREATDELFLRSHHQIVPTVANLVEQSNVFLTHAVNFLATDVPGKGEPAGVPMLYSDPTWRPAKARWLDDIQGEFYANRMPMTLGRRKVAEDGSSTIFGPLVISRAYVAKAALLPFLNGTAHWRSYLSHEIGSRMVEAITIGSGKDSVLKPHYPKKR